MTDSNDERLSDITAEMRRTAENLNGPNGGWPGDAFTEFADRLDALSRRSADATPVAGDELPPGEWWMFYDNQAGHWCVKDDGPWSVVRTGAEVFHVREVRPDAEPVKETAGGERDKVAWELEDAKRAHFQAFEGDFSGDIPDSVRDKANVRLWRAVEAVLDLYASPLPAGTGAVTDEMVIRAARGIWDAGEVGVPFETAPKSVAQSLMKQARAALTAALQQGETR